MVVGPMQGDTDDVMAKAVERSSFVIVFVSKRYKESANCRQEAQYARGREKRGRVKMLYVMTDAKYTSVSEPEAVDGWLGMMVGQQLW